MVKFQAPIKRDVNFGDDDPFQTIFLKNASLFKSTSQDGERKGCCTDDHDTIGEDVPEDTTEEKKVNVSDECSHCSDESACEYHWRNKMYWALPENVRNAIDMAKMKRKHSDFYYRLNLVNDKLHVYTSLFYNKVPCYQQTWQEKKVKKLEN